MLMLEKKLTKRQQAKLNREAAKFDELVAKVTPFLEAYKDDLLVHDKGSFEAHGGLPYIHITRSTGTGLYYLFPADHDRWPAAGVEVKYLFGVADRRHILRQIYECVESEWYHDNRGEKRMFHYFDGKKLREVSGIDAVKLAKDHQTSVFHIWNK